MRMLAFRYQIAGLVKYVGDGMVMRRWAVVMVACAIAGFSFAKAGPLDLPKPEVFIRTEDQQRALLFGKPCSNADVGRGCYRYNGRLMREIPCAYHIDASTIGSLPTDQCFKMETPRRYRGVWIDEFEGQVFIPEGTTTPEWPRTHPKSPGWREQFDGAQAASIWIDVGRVKISQELRKRSHRMLIDFIGRKTMYSGSYGHMGMSGNEIIVDRVISISALK